MPLLTDFEYFKLVPKLKEKHRKTVDYYVMRLDSKDVLGEVNWYSPWRQHVFTSEKEVVWSSCCLEDIRLFMASLQKERRLRNKSEKSL